MSGGLDMVTDIASWLLIVTGGLFCVISGVGLLRLPEVFTRSHAAGMTDTVGAALILTGLLLQVPDWTVAVRLVLIVAFLVFTGPTATHALARAALADGFKPLASGDAGKAKTGGMSDRGKARRQ